MELFGARRGSRTNARTHRPCSQAGAVQSALISGARSRRRPREPNVLNRGRERGRARKPILTPLLVSASAFECLRILERAEEHVPQRNVREVVGVTTKLMVNPMRFRPLKNKTNPRRRFDIPMIEKLPDCNENGVVTSCVHTGAKQWIHNQTAQDGVN